jgi:hypothetical protein
MTERTFGWLLAALAIATASLVISQGWVNN